jgi:hypothetical protein
MAGGSSLQRLNRHKDMFGNEDRDMNEGINKVRRRRKPMLKEHLNGLKSRKCAQFRLPLFLWGWGIETEAGEVQRVGAVIRNCGAQLFFTYRGIEVADIVIDVDTYRVGQERVSPSTVALSLGICSVSCRRGWPQSRPASSFAHV